jgi:hypothetical protein
MILKKETILASIFMNMNKSRANETTNAKGERHQVLPLRVIWYSRLDHFEEFRNKVEGHFGQIGAGYLFDSNFQEAYLEK